MSGPSGIDLARVALQAARAAAKSKPVQQPKKRVHASSRATGRDPVAFGAAVKGMIAERGWEVSQQGGKVLDQWPQIAPSLAGKVAAEHFDADTKTLHLRPSSPAYRTQLALNERAIIDAINQHMGADSVRALKVLTVGAPQRRQAEPAPEPEAPARPAAAQPPAEPAPKPQGYLEARSIVRSSPRPADVLADAIEAARAQQGRLREPEEQFTELTWQQKDRADREYRQMRSRSRAEGVRAAALRQRDAERDGKATMPTAARKTA